MKHVYVRSDSNASPRVRVREKECPEGAEGTTRDTKGKDEKLHLFGKEKVLINELIKLKKNNRLDKKKRHK